MTIKILDSMVTKRVAISYLLLGAVDASAADCLKDAREVQSSSGAANATKLRTYLCGTAGRNLIRLEFNRLNDLAAGMLLKGILPPPLGAKVSGARIVKNKVLEEFNHLIAEFGVGDGYSRGAFDVRSALPGPGQDNGLGEPVAIDSDIKVIVAAQAMSTAVDFPDADALGSITSKTEVPKGYELVPLLVAEQQKDFYIFIIWRFMRKDEIDQYSQKVLRFNRLVLDSRFGKRRFRSDRIPREMRLYAYLAQRGLPDDFLLIRGVRSEGGCGDVPFWEFKYFPRQLLLNVVIIENITLTNLPIDGLLGAFTMEPTLRATTAARGFADTNGRNVTGSLGVLAPGGRIVVPLSLVWAPSGEIAELWAGTKKSPPKMPSYAWGPQFEVDAVLVDGQQLTLEGRGANYLSVTTSCECGTCPFIYCWDEAGREWVNAGIVLEFANSPEKVTWDWRKFEGAVLKFRVQEDEAEVTYISGVALDVELFDGTLHSLACNGVHGDEAEPAIELMFHEGAEFSFELPPDMGCDDIKSSTFRLRGYYRRYTDILAATHSCVFANCSPD